ncbi:MAG: hypothetical protein R3C46_07230 [Hyphomonadaceae bacterium]
MPIRPFRAALLAAAALALCAPAVAQDWTPPEEAMASGWEPERNAMGQPDFSGAWGNESLTPFERPASMGARKVLTPLEVEQREGGADKRWAAANAPTDPGEGVPDDGRTGGYNSYWVGNNNRVMRVGGEPRTSLVTFPESGRIPARKADAPPKQTSPLQTIFFTPDVGDLDSYEVRSGAERCIFWPSQAGAVLRAAAYNTNYQITQGTEAVAIMAETIHDTRIIRLNAKHNPASAVTRPWMGDSIGWYEGDSLVVETINFHPEQYFFYASDQLKVTERFTLVADDRLLYQFKVEDPLVWAEPWGGEYEFSRSPGVWEYACHEGNHGMYNALMIGRMQDAGLIPADKE